MSTLKSDQGGDYALQGAAKLNMNPPKPQATSEGVPRKVCF